MWRKWQILVGVGTAAILLISLIPGCAPAAPGEGAPPGGEKPSYHWRLSNDMPPESIETMACERFAEKVGDASGGRMVIDVYPGGILGDWIAVQEEVMKGTIDMAWSAMSSIWDPRADIVYIPYLVISWEEATKAYAAGGFIYDQFSEMGKGMGFHVLSCYPRSWMGLGTVERPPSPKDPDVPKNMKVRVWACKPAELIMKRFGYIPTVLPWADVFSSLQLGVIDGVYTDLADAYDCQRDLINYWVYDRSLFEGHFCIMHKDLFDSLSSEDQQILVDTALAEQNAEMEVAEQRDEEYMQKFRDQGTEIILFTPEELNKLRDMAIEELWPELYDTMGKILIDDAAAYVETLK